MRRLFIIALVLAFATAANATVLTWSADSLTLSINETAVVTLDADDDSMYDWKWVGHTPASPAIGTIVSIVALPEAGWDPQVQNPSQTGFPGWWTVKTAYLVGPPQTIESGSQFSVTVQGLAVGTFTLYGESDMLNVTVVPEPMTIALLALGSLGLLRKRKR